MRPRTKLLLAGALGLALLAALRVGIRAGAGGRLSAPGVERSSGEPPEAGASAPQPLSTPARRSAVSANPPPSDELVLHGRVVIPAGTPADEELTLALTPWSLELWDRRTQRYELAIAGRREVPFEVPVSPHGEWALEARYLERLEGSYDEETLAHELVLEPALGGIVRGSFTVPEGDRARHFASLAAPDGAAAGFAAIDRQGRFELRVAPSQDLVLALCERFTPAAIRSAEPRASGEAVRAWREGLAVRAGRVTEVELEREPGALVAGRVLDAEGGPVAEARLELAVEQRRAQVARTLQLELQSDAEGRFRAEDLPAGELRLVATFAGVARTELELPPLAPGERRDALTVTLDLGTALRGRVLQPDGRPALRARVTLRQERGDGRSLKTTTDWEGRFVFHGLTHAPCTVTAVLDPVLSPDEPWRRHLIAGIARNVVPGRGELRLQLERGQTLRGHVLDAGGARVRKFRVIAEPIGAGEDDPSRRRVTRSFDAEDGRFELGGLGAGRWSVSARADGHAGSMPLELRLPAAQPVELRLAR